MAMGRHGAATGGLARGRELCGTVSAHLRLSESYPDVEAPTAAASLAKSIANGSHCPPALHVEIEVEIKSAHRRRGIGSAALELLLYELGSVLPEVACAVAKVPMANATALAFFGASHLGFRGERASAALGLVELRRAPLCQRRWPCYYINVDGRDERKAQVEETLRMGGLQPTRVAACIPSDREVQEAAQACPGKAVGWHANAASHAKIWQTIAASAGSHVEGRSAASAAGSGGDCAELSFVFEDDVLLHHAWIPMLEAIVERAKQQQQQSEASAPLDCVMLDGLCLAGEMSSQHGWLGPPDEGPSIALGICFSSAYALTPSAAAWLLQRRASLPYSNAESYLMQLQEERKGAVWVHVPRLALQRWDECSSTVSTLSPPMMREWYEKNYFPRYPRSLYAPRNSQPLTNEIS